MNNPQKICAICGLDCSTVTRYQSPDGRYFCQPCYEGLLQPAATDPLPSAPPPPPSLHIAPKPTAPAVSVPAGRARSSPPGRSPTPSSFRSPVLIGGGVILAFVLMLIMGRFVPAMGILYLAGCLLFALGLGIAVLVSAFRTSLVQGLLTFFVPFYALYYVFGVSRNKLLMVLTPVPLILAVGMLLLPAGGEPLGITSESTRSQAGSTNEKLPMSPAIGAVSDQDLSRRVVAGYSVAVTPRGNMSAFSRLSGGRQLTTSVGGRRITFQSDKSLAMEQWNVGDQQIMIVNDELFVNHRGYGALKPGDEILVNHGVVFVGSRPATEKTGTVHLSISR